MPRSKDSFIGPWARFFLTAVLFLGCVLTAAGQDSKLESFSYDFEKGSAQGWGPRGSVQVASIAEAAHSGAFGLSTTSRGENWHGPAINLGGTLKAGAKYTLTAFLRLAQAPTSPSSVKFTMEEKAGGKTNWKTVAQAQASTTEWLQLTGTYSFEGAMDALTLYAESSNPADAIFIDDVKIQMTAPPTVTPATVGIEKDLKAVKDGFTGFFSVGAAITPNLAGPAGDLVIKHFNSVVAENAMKALYIEPAEGKFFWNDADAIVAFAKAHAMEIRFHTLLWHEQCPNWFFVDAQGKEMVDEKDPAQKAANKKLLLARLTNHVKTIVARYKNDIRSWDVVNEVIDPAGPGGLRNSKWFQIAGKDFIETAFRAAREAGGPQIKLYITDYNTHDPAKRDILLKLVKELRAQGVPIDGIGHQTHVNLAYPPIAQIKDSIRMFGELGLDNQVTELDMGVYSDDTTAYAKVPEDLLIRQAYRYKDLFDAFKELNQYISNVTLWGIGDGTSWLQNRPIPRADAPLLFDAQYQAKYAYYGLMAPQKLPPLPAPAQPKVPPKVGQARQGTPKIDGQVEAQWARSPVLAVALAASGKPSGSAQVRALWDKDFLYLLFEVKDPLLNKASANAYEQDSIEAFVSESNAKAGAYLTGDGQFRVNFENALSFGSNGEDKKVVSAAKVVPGGYVVELAVPLKTGAGVTGKVLGFDAQVNDADASGTRVGILKWNDSSDNSWRDTLNWGELKLVD